MEENPSSVKPSGERPYRLYGVLHQPGNFSKHSGMYPLAQAMGAEPVFYRETWKELRARSWTLGHSLKRVGCSWYGCDWNALIPVVDEVRLAQQIRGKRPRVVHYIWAEFARPSWPGLLKSKTDLSVGTFHASIRNLQKIMHRDSAIRSFDLVTLMSKTQLPWFLDHGFKEEELHVIHHGVDMAYFCPGDQPYTGGREGPLKGLLVGFTERDHAFMVEVLKALPEGVLQLEVLTGPNQKKVYNGAPHVDILPFISDEELLEKYRQADLLVMPMLDCTANNVILESMACGTPVMTNLTGGIGEYVDPATSFVHEGKNVDDWVDLLVSLSGNREDLWSRREPVRKWAEGFDWNDKAAEFNRLILEKLGQS